MAIANPEEIMARAKEREEELQKMVYVEGDYIVINVHYGYNIELSRCDTHAKIVAWAIHLIDKTWMTNDVLQRFMRLAMQKHNLEAPMP